MNNSIRNPIATLQLLSEEQINSQGLFTVLAPHAARTHMLALAARLAWRGPLQVLDAGNRFNAYQVARFLRGDGAEDFRQALDRIRVARAFTPTQMLALLQATPASKDPTLVLDLLSTFYDESLPFSERQRTLLGCILELKQLSSAAPVVVSVRPPPPSEPDPLGFIDLLQEQADQVYFFEEIARPVQPPLFSL